MASMANLPRRSPPTARVRMSRLMGQLLRFWYLKRVTNLTLAYGIEHHCGKRQSRPRHGLK